ncbi:hypothetical protein pEaSNUABM14_00105 [Erwinia phage pEa_SNUABM_14]|uniref:Uncharacterized protein n=1 Tax=Erwinia phage pEa_SNUABM_7 TaxID=2866695 RepID=A0AAE7WSU7_9CAUD|nr:membrane protein [Erwinia phage pEa_SNUABM_7]QYW03065.1 hypothetical protein pEaSNUABM13_00106 [Erwinia phage pEa_SNUABM_13]QYW03406.1 hypothetical protein pEaSNUABM34_00104 [Erwinia phage pEa_SNUABM_34]QYW03748.1 hypothetical protein pEaSNUABM45_00105 [Erwinia phage pEa_SNUABM_45]QYW04089.1 hypothetical protein pEaSNUABM46_00105 [Erwinia phage pEa_SNUABM_46]QYW04430.1 hypothetical protein pEaSNUABM14_00105 [Erwinia phage pEa_SNUABM_14]QYW05119.1 hypothetical protein pEaSNUABM21_00105 [Erw
MWAEILGQVLASNFATVLSVVLLIAGAGFYWWKVIPDMQDYERVKEKLAELEANPVVLDGESLEAELAQVLKALNEFSETTQVDNIDLKEGLNSVLRAVQRFERIISQQSRDHQESVDLMREVLGRLDGNQHELEKLGLRLQSLSSSLYTAPPGLGASESNDLRKLR